MYRTLLALLPCLLAGVARAAMLSTGPVLAEAQEQQGRLAALTFQLTLFGEGEPLAAVRLLAPDFRNHDVEEPSGADAYAGFFLDPARFGNPAPLALHRGLPPAPARRRLFAVTDGDLTMLAYLTGGGEDPAARFGSNLFEVQDGRVTQLWYSGPVAVRGVGPVVSSSVPDDLTRWYQPPYGSVGQLSVIIPAGDQPRAVREANKALVERFFTSFFVGGDRKAGRVLSASLVSHVPQTPSGAAFGEVARKHQERVTAPDVQTPLFVLAEGDLVAIGFGVPYASDPGALYAQNVLRVRNGKIVEWWYSGFPQGHPRGVWRMPKAKKEK